MDVNRHVQRCVIMARRFNHLALSSRKVGDDDTLDYALGQKKAWMSDARMHSKNDHRKLRFYEIGGRRRSA
jgi:hypothetical protein